MSLHATDFPAFFQALWDHPPFPWQTRLLEQVRTSGWPSTLDLPTGSGKTAVLDIALFALALDAFEEPANRTQPRRIALVVDRRVVVDQAYQRAVELATRLRDAEDGILADTASALRALQHDEHALPVLPAVLRGGMPRESDWALWPQQPVLLVSTVDQVGSRLLFRGYGVSDRMKPVHAGLLGCDTLYLLDEVHLSRPFEQTLDAVRRYAERSGGQKGPLLRPLTFVRMSATVAERAADTFSLSGADREQETLARRLRAAKVASLREVQTPKSPPRAREALARSCVAEAKRLSEGSGVIALIVNRVDTARRAAEIAGKELGGGWDVELMTGRMRPLDREDLQSRLLDRIRAGRPRDPEDRVLLVSTQAIEAGADLDFDALVTECASLDALRQRFGRLDRLGELVRTKAVILAASTDVAESAEPDPIYGEALRNTWLWLSQHAAAEAAEGDSANSEHGGIDFGIDALDSRLAELDAPQRASLLAPRSVAPVLFGSHLDRWAQTSPIPLADPEVAPFLHGPERGAPDVQIVWRADVEAETLTEEGLLHLRTVLGAVPPSSLEALPVPVGAARSWLAAVAARRDPEAEAPEADLPPVADVEGGAPASEAPPLGSRARRSPAEPTAPALIWRGDRSVVLDRGGTGALPPGATLVVPSSYGGLDPDFHCWSPEAVARVPDRGDEAQLRQRGRAIVRWSPAVLASWELPTDLASGPTLARDPETAGTSDEDLDAAAEDEVFEAWRAAVLAAGSVPAWAKLALEHLDRPRNILRSATWRATWGRRRVPREALRALSDVPSFEQTSINDAATEGDEGSFTGDEIPLARHLDDVARMTRRFADALALPDSLASDLERAASLHDLGKCDGRFQLLLHGGDAVAQELAEEPLAKSAQNVTAADRRARARARQRARYPSGTRHELTSVALIEQSPALERRANDWDLVRHLIAAHHGYCRPFAPPPDADDEPVEIVAERDGLEFAVSSDHGLVRFDSGVADRYWKLVRRYGWWSLAWLEAILRLADHRASEGEAWR
ncbi:MAG TPA: type I-U CRISPR-associated helicase/endonuclease Cas3 [Thermoanaerobaculia bacterium]|nr:type I-U CRISPR-associated helicase/endonuclease Cas3 [Thermoanaerobaculia bacterium]